jgi:hypothetical protein
MSGVIIAGDTSGSVTLQAPAVAGSTVITLPSTSGTMALSGGAVSGTTGTFSGNVTAPNLQGPAFSAYGNGGQSISPSTATKIALQNEYFDTANCFDSTTNYRFTPNVSGYYQVNGNVGIGVASGSGYTAAVLYKNGSPYTAGAIILNNATYGSNSNFSAVVYFNGTTDYVEMYIYLGAVSGTTQANFIGSYEKIQFSAAMVRGA